VNQSSRALLEELGEYGKTPALCTTNATECEAYGCLEDVRPQFFQPLEMKGKSGQCTFFFFVMNMLAFPLNPHMVQRVYIAQSDQALRFVVGIMFVAGFLCMPPGMMAGLVVATFSKTWTIEPSSPFAAVAAQLMEMGPLQYVLAVVLTCSSLAAIMSTADSVMLGVSNTLSLDLFKGYISPRATESMTVHFGTAVSAIMVLIGILFGFFITDKQFGTLLLLQNGILLQVVPAYVLGLYFDPSPLAVACGLGAGLVVFFAAFTLSNLGMNPTKDYVPEPNLGFFVNIAVLLVSVLTNFSANKSPNYHDASSGTYINSVSGKPSSRLSLQEIEDCMVNTSEPPRFLLLIILALVLGSTPIWSGDDYKLVLGMPDWAFTIVMISIAAAVLGIIGTCLWQPVRECDNAVEVDSESDYDEDDSD